MTLGNLDLKLINLLQKDGRASYVELAKKLGVVEGTVRKRVRKLIKDDVIRITTLAKPAAMGYVILSVIGLQVQMSSLRSVANVLKEKPTVCYLAFVTGRYDLMCIVAARSPQELSHFIEKDISEIPGIMRTETFVNLDVIKGLWQGIDIIQLLNSPEKANKKGKVPTVTPSK